MLAGRYALYIGAVGGKQWAMRMRNWVLGLLLLAGGVSRGWEVSSLRYNVDVWRGRGGQNELPENTVIALAQTRDGYLWLGTQDGLARFDGLQFNTFDKANTPGLNSVLIAHIFEDSASNLWVGTVLGGITLIKNGSA